MTPLLFMHIHKTGGQSLSRFLEQFFAPEEICPHNTDYAILTCNTHKLACYRFFRGHISPCALSQRIPAFSTVTVLRNPRERLISAFRYWARPPSGNEGRLPAFRRTIAAMTLADFLSNPATRNCCDNVQARLLAGGRFGTTKDERIMVYGELLPPQADKFAYIGKTDNLDAAARAICDIFGFTPPETANGSLVDRLNVSGQQPITLTSEEDELLELRTRYDRMAYDAL